ncbi:unnamed protein product [Clonostachys chloroleuca]|uniref:Uncharacterized protein n=1 Tax=Clonostachys chloroleuca TaxID=1926264 RepID=A0AA35VEK7_9HYPO|nr:unnamed protein product [Clonostachys chloroleuca]
MQAGACHSNILATVISYESTLYSQLIASLRLGLYLHGPGHRVVHNARTENTMGRTRRDMKEAGSIRGERPPFINLSTRPNTAIPLGMMSISRGMIGLQLH